MTSVALGPSLGRWHGGLQRRLGDEWVVEELISARPAAADEIVVLGTPELPAGRVESGYSPTRRRLVIGTGPGSPGQGAPEESVPRILDRLSAILRTYPTTTPPTV
jgi:hypothetical protein